jgi:hypothetical protein
LEALLAAWTGWSDRRRHLHRHPRRAAATVGPSKTLAALSVAKPITFALEPDMALGAALDGFMRENTTVLPVTLGQWRNTLIGEVSRQDVLLAVQDRLTFPKSSGPNSLFSLPGAFPARSSRMASYLGSNSSTSHNVLSGHANVVLSAYKAWGLFGWARHGARSR